MNVDVKNDVSRQLKIQTISFHLISSLRIENFITNVANINSENSKIINSMIKSRNMSEWWFWDNQKEKEHFFEDVNSMY
jgi:hypothetical protein